MSPSTCRIAIILTFAVINVTCFWLFFHPQSYTGTPNGDCLSSSASSTGIDGAKSGNNIFVEKRKKKLGDGCFHVFLDVGANIGVHTRFLYEPNLYPNTKTAASFFNEQFGTSRDNHDFCAFGFEPNPAHRKRHENLMAHFKAGGLRYHYIGVAVSDSVGNMTFYHNQDEAKEEWGFSDHVLNKDAVAEVVPKIRLADWIMDEIYDREMPSIVLGDYADKKPKVVMKMDIESQEYAVLPDLMFSGVLCKTIDFVFGEFHHWNIHYPPDEVTGRGGLELGARESLKFKNELLRGFHSVKHCRTASISGLEDESYLHDGVALLSYDNGP
eukprot:CAMPEP_0171383662 /NCGR_PEP_ID=MMETSP0879-20121228/36985_1 /TAXON_ID=67004 /ORGANISM="Thalassiosira weissflogii, Strain CCMP1336" /LENGTH=326 /DNA_ID=CAMNT_0011895753 /DNA_START=149 /DNA_END=1126 /DNA_ORIENTATION=+